MDASFRPRKTPSTDRLLSLFSKPGPSPASAPALSSSAADGELDEGEVFWTGTDFAVSSTTQQDGLVPPSSTSSPPPSPSPASSRAIPSSPSLASVGSFRRASFGILAALPEDADATACTQNMPRAVTRSPSFLSQSVVVGGGADGSISSSPSTASPSPLSSTAARAIPAIPRPRQDYASFSMPVRQQSAPVNVPLPPGRPRARRVAFGEDEPPLRQPPRRPSSVAVRDEEEEEMMPPHEIVARASAKESPMTTFSVLEGAGRTLKGRDLRRVRNAVWRQTGFLD